MSPDHRLVSPESHTLARVANGVIGTLVGVYAVLDDLLLGPILRRGLRSCAGAVC